MPQQSNLVMNAKPVDWIEKFIPTSAQPYLRLVRLDRPIGTWLLLLPCWWGVVLASKTTVTVLGYFLVFAVGAIIMRGAGCIINDIYDRKLDAQVERTRNRPIASGVIKVWQALLYLVFLMALGFCILLSFNRATLLTGLLSLPLVLTYPLMKRITWWPQLFLGFTFNWGVLLGTTAVQGSLSASSIIMYAAGIMWTLAYDTIYAHQDKHDDVLVGIRSTALLLGASSKVWVALFFALAGVLVLAAGFVNGLSVWFLIGLVPVIGLTIYHLVQWDMDNPKDCLLRFCANRDIGLLLLAALILGKYI